MKHFLFFCASLLFSTLLPAQNNSTDLAAIKNIIQQQENAWNKHDWKSFSNHFTDDTTLINFIGQFWKGRTDIFTNFTQLNDCCLSATSLKFVVNSVRFISPDVAIVYIEETLVTDKDYDTPFQKFKKGDTDYKIISDVFVKKSNAWAVTAMQVALINQLITPHKVENGTVVNR